MMKYLLFLAFVLSSGLSVANEEKNEWNATKLTDETIKKIQQSQYQYKKCVIGEMQKKAASKIEVKGTTDTIINQCESVLSDMRQVYLDSDVPGVIADRHLKKMRIEITRRVIKQLMFTSAARKAGVQ